jgi:hypothetical protein
LAHHPLTLWNHDSGMARTRIARWLALLTAAGIVCAASVASAARLGPGPGRLGDYFFGPKLARAEIVMVEAGVVHDYRVDRGRIRNVNRAMIELKELDGQFERIPIAPTTGILVNGQPVPPGFLARGMVATAIRDGNAPAQWIIVNGPKRR